MCLITNLQTYGMLGRQAAAAGGGLGRLRCLKLARCESVSHVATLLATLGDLEDLDLSRTGVTDCDIGSLARPAVAT